MSDCSSIRRVFSLFLDGELDEVDYRTTESHLTSCQACREEHETFLKVISGIREAMSVKVELPAATRRRIADQAANRALGRPWLRTFPIFSPRVRQGLLLAAAAVVLALVALPVAMRQGGKIPRHADVATIRVTSDGLAVRLAWSDGPRESYTVYKSYDPKSLLGAEVHVVKGNVWVDRDSARSPIVFYRIE